MIGVICVEEIVKEYGRVMVAVLECLAMLGVIGYLYVQSAQYIEFVAEGLMGG